MRKLLVIAPAAAVLAIAASAAVAAAPQHFRFTENDHFVDASCGFPIVGDFTFTNDITEFDAADGTPVRLQLHQSDVGTLTANGVTLEEKDHTQTFVTFVNGTATQAIHVGTLFHMVGPGGTIFLIAGQEVWEVEGGFDHTLISFHGVDFGGDDATFCAAFS